jgi:hypothetical protein
VVGSLAPALLFLFVQLAGCLLGSARLTGRSAPHDQPDQHDEQDCRADDADDPESGFVHSLLLAREPPALSPYIARNGAIGFLD